jgi:hypothetical protein
VKTASHHHNRESLFMDYHPEFKDSLPPEPQLREAEWLQESRAEIERRSEWECCSWVDVVISVIAAVVLALCGTGPATHAAFLPLVLLRNPPRPLDLDLLLSSGAIEPPMPGLLARFWAWLMNGECVL